MTMTNDDLKARAENLGYTFVHDHTTDDPDRWVIRDLMNGTRVTATTRRGLVAWIERREAERA